MSNRIKCIVMYNGSRFNGFQRQPRGRTVQDTLEKALSTIHKEPIQLHGCGRTDAQVHAYYQVFHFDTNLDIPASNWKRAINSLLPKDVYIKDVEIVDTSFHARYSAKSKEYRYYLSLDEYDPIKMDMMAFKRYQTLDVDKMVEAIELFKGTHDFTSFTGQVKKNCVRTIHEAEIVKHHNHLEFIFRGNGFLRYQIRIMVGTLIEIGEGRRQLDSVNHLYEIKDRQKAGFTADPQGLYLYHVEY